ncbi:MAG TPA: SRPBCC family protein [Solirubrobacterales bacterium]|nr:SRPBCC family protein [Solirubrobacterales bacterium]
MGTLEASWSVEIDAPRDRCYEIAADIEGAPAWQGTLERAEVLKRDREGRAVVVDTTSDASIKKVHSRLRFSYQPPGGITWEQEEGEAKWLTGSWEFEEVDEGRTRATYGLRSDPGRILSLLLRGPVEGKVKELLTKGAAEGLKKKAEGSA